MTRTLLKLQFVLWGRSLRKNPSSMIMSVLVFVYALLGLFSIGAMTAFAMHEGAYAAVAGAVGVEPSRAVFVGDRLRDDVSGAKAVGMRTVHLVGRPVEGFDVVPDAELLTLDGLVELVDAWRST